MKKKNKHLAKKKEQHANLCVFVESSLSPHPESSFLFSSCFVPAPVPALVSALVPVSLPASLSAPFFRFRSPFILLSSCVPAPATVSHCEIRALLLPLLVLDLPLSLRPSPLRIFKQSLLDEPQPYISTSPAKPFYRFPALDTLNLYNNNSLYNPTNINKCKWGFDIGFINSRSLAGNHD